MPEFIETTGTFVAFLFIGFIPLYFVSRFFLTRKGSFIVALGFAPVLVALQNLFIVVAGLQHSIIRYLIPAAVLYFLIKAVRERPRIEYGLDTRLTRSLFIGFLFGFVYWWLAFGTFSKEHFLAFPDATWNFGLIAELKNHFPPVDPHWFSGKPFIYHYLTNIYLAGISNFSGIDILQAVSFVNFTTCISIFIIVSLFVNEKFIVESLLIFSISIMVSFTETWPVFEAFHRHLSSMDGATTFFWSLPTFLSSIYIWVKLNGSRENIPLKFFAIIIFIGAFSVFYSKVTYITVFLFFELVSFLRVVKLRKIWTIQAILREKKLLFSYSFLPGFLIVFILINIVLIPTTQDSIMFGIETRDFLVFGSWNPIYPFLAVYLVTLVFLLIDFRNLRSYGWELISCSIFNFALFLTTKHMGYSDLYFIFNAIFLNIFFILSGASSGMLVKFLSSWFICMAILMSLSVGSLVHGFTNFSITASYIRPKLHGDTIPTTEVQEYLSLGSKLDDNALIHHLNKRQINSFYILL